MKLARLLIIPLLMGDVTKDHERLVLHVGRLVGLLGLAGCAEGLARAGNVSRVERGNAAVVGALQISQLGHRPLQLPEKLGYVRGELPVVGARLENEVLQVHQAVLHDANDLEHHRNPLLLVARSPEHLRKAALQR